MIQPLFAKIIGIVGYFYERVFHEKVSVDVEKFIKNLSYLSIGTLISTVFSFAFNILAGRWLGPSEYGFFTLVQSVAMFLYIPMTLGFTTALVKYNCEKIDFFRQRKIISTTFILVFLFTTASLVVYLIFSRQVMALFSITEDIFYFSLAFAVLFVFYNLMAETLRSIHKIYEYSLFKPIYTVILFFSFLVFVFVFRDLLYTAPLFSMLIAYGITGGILLAFLRDYVRPEFSRPCAVKLQTYSIFSLTGGISAAFYQNIGKIILNMYLPVAMVGIYWAYTFSFTTIILLFSTIFVTVFFPVASMCRNKEMLFTRINKVVILFIAGGWLFTLVSGYVILKMYGSEYPFDLPLTLLSATAGVCISVDMLYGQLLNSVGVAGVKITSYAAVVLAVLSVLLSFLFIPLFGLSGAMTATIISYASGIGIMLYKWPDLMNPGRSMGD
jgi:O-antigen/teichoic acid export membrane protein